ncbi:MAG TPA: helix-turn-helix domain-containing protein [Oculatellaceae cyanobacterium]
MGSQALDANKDPLAIQGLEDLLLAKPGPDDTNPDKPTPDSPPTPENWWTLAEATGALSINERTLRRWIKQGKIEAAKVQGPWGEEWRIKPGSVRASAITSPGSVNDSPDRTDPSGPPTPDYNFQEMVALKTRLEIVERQNEEMREQLQGATFRNGYLVAQLESKDRDIKLLTDSQHKQGWWTRFCSWLVGSKA